MERVGFVGAYDKTDLIIYTAKVLTELGNKILIIDATQKQKARYIVPAINPTVSYITEFEKIDVAVGFGSFEEIQEYIGEYELDYDVVLIDVDSSAGIRSLGLEIVDRTYFVTAFDLYSLKKGIECLENIKNPLKLNKIFFSKNFYKEDDEYLNFLSLGKKVIWNDDVIYFPTENGDETALIENQRLGKIKFKNLSPDFKEGISYLAGEISGNNSKVIRNIIKNLE